MISFACKKITPKPFSTFDPRAFGTLLTLFFCCKHISWNNFSPQSKFPTFIYWRLEFRFFLLLCRNRRNKSDSIFRWLFFCDGLAELGLWWQTNVLHRRRQNDYSNFFVQMPSSFSHQKSTVHTCWWFCLNNGRHTCYWSVFTLEKLFFFKEGMFDKWCVIISYYFRISFDNHTLSSKVFKHLKLYGYENYTAWMGQT